MLGRRGLTAPISLRYAGCVRYAQGGGPGRRDPQDGPRALASNQIRTLSRINTLIGRRFHMSCTVQGFAALVPDGRTVVTLDAWLAFGGGKAGFSMTSRTTRIWSHHGRIPVVRVQGPGRSRLRPGATNPANASG
ncbi:hypothetical protein GPN2_11909 [Streptomyces murinus]